MVEVNKNNKIALYSGSHELTRRRISLVLEEWRKRAEENPQLYSRFNKSEREGYGDRCVETLTDIEKEMDEFGLLPTE